MAQPVTRFRRGMTVLDRQKYRAYLLEKELEKARIQAGLYHLTERCRRAMALTGTADHALAGQLHAACQGEAEPRGTGCLCYCHDDHRGGVVAGEVIAPDHVDEPVRHLEE